MGTRQIFRGSPTGADGKIYCISEDGTVVVLSAGDEFKILSTIPMGEGKIYASIVAASGHLFIRTAQNLYCIGKK
jgi:outer membrane protein assembly factor BamB